MGSLVLTLSFVAAPAASWASDTQQSQPPAFLENEHVCNGCHLSTMCFLAKYTAAFPNENGQPLVISMMNRDGVRRSHTIALMSWRGAAWCRDEYFGVFSLGASYTQNGDLSRLARKAQQLLERHAQNLVRTNGLPQRPEVPSEDAVQQRFEEAKLATRILPFSSSLYWVRSGSHEVPMVLFRPSPGVIGVYEPIHGTCLAECSIRDDAKVVALASEKLGYRPDSLRREASVSSSVAASALSASNAVAVQ